MPVQWLGRPGVHLQTATDLGGTWTDLYNTDGTNWTAGVYAGPSWPNQCDQLPSRRGATFFRLVKPGP